MYPNGKLGYKNPASQILEGQNCFDQEARYAGAHKNLKIQVVYLDVHMHYLASFNWSRGRGEPWKSLQS